MISLTQDQAKNKLWQLVAIIVLLSMAFINCYKTTFNLLWAFDFDFDRDMSFAQGTLDGYFGKDPNYVNEYLWYNPLLFLIETVLVKITELPINIVVVRAGTYLNLLGPIFFSIMIAKFFNLNTVLAALLSYLFLSTGDLMGWGAATYSPWLYPGAFFQFVFYINILLCYKAFTTQKYSWFAVLGIFTGVSFLGHTAPTILIIFILLSMQFGYIFKALKSKQYLLVRKFILQGILVLVLFVVVSMPFLYFIIGKYKLQIVNRIAFEYFDYLFIPENFFILLKANLSVTLLISLIGFIAFHKNCADVIVRKLIFNWFYISTILFIYTTLVPIVEFKYKIKLPGLVPSFHFFFYLKAMESVFFGYGLLISGKKIISFISNLISKKRGRMIYLISIDKIFIVVVLIIVLLYLPYYSSRKDFVTGRELSIEKENNTSKIQVYEWIVKNVPSQEVILCERSDAIFPVMATGRKMVSINATFSNPYLDFSKRENDRELMITYLSTGYPGATRELFDYYNVSTLLLNNSTTADPKVISKLFQQITFQNNQYTIYKK